MKICRIKDLKEECEIQPHLTKKAFLLHEFMEDFYKNNPTTLANEYLFLQMGEEFIWKFLHCGWPDVFFPIDRLPRQFEEYLKMRLEKTHDNYTYHNNSGIWNPKTSK
jgi:hypothetical protein